MIEYICDCCKTRSLISEDIPEYTMFVCHNYGGDTYNICNKCEKRIQNILTGKELRGEE